MKLSDLKEKDLEQYQISNNDLLKIIAIQIMRQNNGKQTTSKGTGSKAKK